MMPKRKVGEAISKVRLQLSSGEPDAVQLRAWRALWQRLLSDDITSHAAQTSAEKTLVPSAADTAQEANSG
jgi:hypothetical protein